MYHIAIVEDERTFSEQLQEFLKEYQEEKNIKFKISVFKDGAEILEEYKQIYDIILLDIEMPEINGMETARRIRKTDAEVVLMFITNMASYAIHGYEVGALDFIMKPLTYYTFSVKLTRALRRVKKKEQKEILLTLPNGAKKIEIQQLYYVEVQNRILHKGDNAERGTKACTISVCKVQSLVYRESDACVRSERQHCSCRWKQAGDQQAE